MVKVTLYLDDVETDLRADVSAQLNTVIDIGDGQDGVVGRIVAPRMETLTQRETHP